MRRHEIKDEDWERIKDLLPGQPGDPGVTAKDNRLFVNAVLWIGKTGAPWRDMPERFGPWGSVWKRFDRWAKKGVWERVFESLQDPDLEWMILDSDAVVAAAKRQGAEAVIPSKKNRKVPRDYDKHLYKERKKVEWFINLLKQ